MTGRYHHGSCQVIPRAVLAGDSREHGCQRPAPAVMPPVSTGPGPATAWGERRESPAA